MNKECNAYSTVIIVGANTVQTFVTQSVTLVTLTASSSQIVLVVKFDGFARVLPFFRSRWSVETQALSGSCRNQWQEWLLPFSPRPLTAVCRLVREGFFDHLPRSLTAVI